jgi:hypothetical protein
MILSIREQSFHHDPLASWSDVLATWSLDWKGLAATPSSVPSSSATVRSASDS